MNIISSSLLFRCFVLASFMGFVTACGGEDPPEDSGDPESLVECGAGTVLQDGLCVVDEFNCPEGQVPTPAGPCSTPEVYCGSGAAFDSETGQCVSSADVRCGPGTVAVNNRCVVEGAAVCGEGTVLVDGFCALSEEVCGDGTELEGLNCQLAAEACSAHAEFDVGTGQCVDRDIIECGENTMESDNQCVSLHTFVEELAAEADLEFSTGATIEVGSEPGEQVIFTGNLTTASNLFHVYKLQAEAGQWLEVKIYSQGLPSPGFRVRQIFGPWQRRALPGYSNLPARTMLFPATEEYDLIVETSLSGVSGGPFGDESWNYVGVVTVLEAPEAQPWELYSEPIAGDLKDTRANFIEVELSDEAETLVLPEIVGQDANTTFIEMWNSPVDYAGRVPVTQNNAVTIDTDRSTAYLLIDSRDFVGPRTEYALTAVETDTLEVGATFQEEVYAEAGQVIFLSHRSSNTATLTARVYLEDDELYSNSVQANNRTSYTALNSRYGFFYAPVDGAYIVEFENTTTNVVTGLFTNSWAADVPVFSVDPVETSYLVDTLPADGLDRGDWRFYLIETEDAARVVGSAEVQSGRPDISIFNVQGDRIENFAAFNAGNIQEAAFNLWTGGVYFMAIRPFNTISGDIKLDFEAFALEALPPSETYSTSFSAEIFDVLTGTAVYFDGGAPDLRLINPNGAFVFEDLAMDYERDILELIPGSGTYTLEMVNHTEDPTLGFQIDTQVTTPFEVLNLTGGFERDFLREGALAEGEREMIVLRSLTDLIFGVVATFGEDEEAHIRLRDLNTSETVLFDEVRETIDLTSRAVNASNFVLEIEAITDIEAGYDLHLSGAEISLLNFSKEYEERVPLEYTGEETGGYLSSLEVSGCPSIGEVEITGDFDTAWRGYLHIFLHVPGMAEPIHILQPEGFGTRTQLVFPDNINTTESLDFAGQSGNGEWTLELTSTTAGTLKSHMTGWSIDLICAV